nr:MAG TPA: hypothetical protein [Caudoviricetes sp.]
MNKSMFVATLRGKNVWRECSLFKIIADTQEVTEETIQQVKRMVKERFGLTLNVMTGKTSDSDTFLSIENVDILD